MALRRRRRRGWAKDMSAPAEKQAGASCRDGRALEHFLIPLDEWWGHPLRCDADAHLEHCAASHYQQLPEWGHWNAEGAEFSVVVSLDAGRVVASSLLRRRQVRWLGAAKYYVDRGPIVEHPRWCDPHLGFLIDAVSRDGIWLSVSPYASGAERGVILQGLRAAGFVPEDLGGHYRASVLLALGADVDALRRGFRRSLKAQLNRALRSGIEVREWEDETDFTAFAAAHNQLAEARGFSGLAPATATRMARALARNPSRGTLLLACHRGERVGGILVLRSGPRVTYAYGYSDQSPEQRQLPLTHLLQWAAIQWAKESGARLYDLGGYWAQRGDSDPLNRFKTGFSKRIEEFVPEHVLYLRPRLAAALMRVRRLRNAGRRA